MEMDGVDDCVWRGDLHKSLLLLDEHKIRPNEESVNEKKIKKSKYIPRHHCLHDFLLFFSP